MDCSAGHQPGYRPGAAFGDRAPPATCPTDRAATVTFVQWPSVGAFRLAARRPALGVLTGLGALAAAASCSKPERAGLSARRQMPDRAGTPTRPDAPAGGRRSVSSTAPRRCRSPARVVVPVNPGASPSVHRPGQAAGGLLSCRCPLMHAFLGVSRTGTSSDARGLRTISGWPSGSVSGSVVLSVWGRRRAASAGSRLGSPGRPGLVGACAAPRRSRPGRRWLGLPARRRSRSGSGR